MRSIALLIMLATPAAAFDPTGSAVGDAFLAALEASGASNAAVESIERDGTTLILQNVSANVGNRTDAFTVESVTIKGGAVGADNALSAEDVTYRSVAIEERTQDSTARTTIGTVTLQDVTFPANADGGAAGLLTGSFGTIAIDDLVAPGPGGDTVRVARTTLTVSERDWSQAVGGEVEVTGFAFNASLLDEPATSELTALGYETVSVDMTAKGRWEAVSGAASLSDFSLSAADVGRLSMAAELSGITAEAAAALETQTGDLTSLLAALDSATVERFSLIFTDQGLTNRLLERAATTSNAPQSDVVRALLDALTQGLRGLDNARFAQEVQDAARTFLAAPRTVTFTANPASPVSLAQVLGAGLMMPGTVPDILNLSVSTAP